MFTRQTYKTRLYINAAQATAVNPHAAEREIWSCPKLSKAAAMEPRMMENSSQARKVRSAAKKTLGSTRTGTWIPVDQD